MAGLGLSGRRWPLVVLSAAVAASAVLVPWLVPQDPSPAPVLAAPTPSPSSPGLPSSPAPVLPSSPSSAASRSPQPVFRPIRVAATDHRNRRVDVAAIDCPTCASGSRIQYVGQGHALVVPIPDVPVAGRRTLVLTYESQGERPLDVLVNDDPVVSLRLPGADSWTTPAQVSLPITLPAGDSTITFFHASAPAPDLDQIVIR